MTQFIRTLATNAAVPRRRRVVVTGMGVVTSLGVGLQHVWSRLCDGHCGIGALTHADYEKIPCKVGGRIPRGSSDGELDLEKYFSKGDLRNLFEGTCFAMVAADEALNMAQWKPSSNREKERTGVAIGMGMVDMVNIYETGTALYNRGYSRVNPHFIPRILVNMPAGHVSQRYGLRGPNHSVSTACTTGVHAIGDATNFIQTNRADVMVCGGTESSLNPLAVAGFARMRALSTKFNDTPEKASRPFDQARDGFVMSEGAGILVLEELEHALNRNAQIYGEVLGYGVSADAHHITAPRDDGSGALSCMRAAVSDAAVSGDVVSDAAVSIAAVSNHAVSKAAVSDAAVSNAAVSAAAVSDAAVSDAAVSDAAVSNAAVSNAAVSNAAVSDAAVSNAAVSDAAVSDAAVLTNSIGYINAHATSTPLGDVAEIKAIKKLLGENTNKVAISATKGATGHLLGAAGAVEAIFTLMACHSGSIPPTLNLENPDAEMKGLNLVPQTRQAWSTPKRIALTNSFGFGGTNGSLCVANFTS